MSRPALILEDLPPVAQQLAQATDLNAVGEFCRRFGGATVSIPTTYRPGSMLEREVGPVLARALVALFGGRPLQVPRLAAVERRARDDSIRADRAAGLTHNRLAVKYGITARQVCRILGSP